MSTYGSLDFATEFALRGSLKVEGAPFLVPYVDVVVNRRCVANVRASKLLQQSCEFSFNPLESLSAGPNVVEIFVSGSDRLLENGSRSVDRSVIADGPTLRPARAREAASSILADPTWKQQAQRFFEFGPGKSVVAFEPDTAHPATAAVISGVDLAISSAPCECFFPSIAPTLNRLYEALNPNGVALLTFAFSDPELQSSYGDLQGDDYFRIYSETELRMFFLKAGFEVLDVVHPVLNSRVLVAGRKP